jgi:hypothetical protein
VSLDDQRRRARRAAVLALRASEVRPALTDERRVSAVEVALRENEAHNRRLNELLDSLEQSLVPLLEQSIGPRDPA